LLVFSFFIFSYSFSFINTNLDFSEKKDEEKMDILLNNSTSSPVELNWVETKWEEMYEGRNPLIVTGIFAFLMHEIVYFGRFIPFLICDFIPYFQKYKLQQVKKS
jgi:hypothetical protein